METGSYLVFGIRGTVLWRKNGNEGLNIRRYMVHRVSHEGTRCLMFWRSENTEFLQVPELGLVDGLGEKKLIEIIWWKQGGIRYLYSIRCTVLWRKKLRQQYHG